MDLQPDDGLPFSEGCVVFGGPTVMPASEERRAEQRRPRVVDWEHELASPDVQQTQGCPVIRFAVWQVGLTTCSGTVVTIYTFELSTIQTEGGMTSSRESRIALPLELCDA
jgi:hypothetical protein